MVEVKKTDMISRMGAYMNLRNLGFLVVGMIAILALGAVRAQAVPIYDTLASGELEGIRSVNNGIIFGGGGAARSASLAWDITAMGDYFHYSYDFSYTSQQGISHFILDLSDDCTKDNGCLISLANNGSVDPDDPNDVVYGTFTTDGNPNFPGSITGAKFNTSGVDGNATFHFEFDSVRVPVYGDFYAKGGNGGGGNGTPNGFAVYNAGAANHLSTNTFDFIARPDTEVAGGDPVPEPASLLLLGTGLGIMGLLATHRRK